MCYIIFPASFEAAHHDQTYKHVGLLTLEMNKDDWSLPDQVRFCHQRSCKKQTTKITFYVQSFYGQEIMTFPCFIPFYSIG